jgi:hypothetical protein
MNNKTLDSRAHPKGIYLTKILTLLEYNYVGGEEGWDMVTLH